MKAFVAVSYVTLWILVIVLLVAVFVLYNHLGQVYLSSRENRAAQGQPAGDLARSFEAESVDGTPVFMPADGPTLLLFTSTVCSICRVLLNALGRLHAAYPSVNVIMICAGRRSMVWAWAGDIGSQIAVIADPHARLRTIYDVDILPFAIAVGADCRVRQCGLVNDYDGLARAAEYAKSDWVERPGEQLMEELSITRREAGHGNENHDANRTAGEPAQLP